MYLHVIDALTSTALISSLKKKHFIRIFNSRGFTESTWGIHMSKSLKKGKRRLEWRSVNVHMVRPHVSCCLRHQEKFTNTPTSQKIPELWSYSRKPCSSKYTLICEYFYVECYSISWCYSLCLFCVVSVSLPKGTLFCFTVAPCRAVKCVFTSLLFLWNVHVLQLSL